MKTPKTASHNQRYRGTKSARRRKSRNKKPSVCSEDRYAAFVQTVEPLMVEFKNPKSQTAWEGAREKILQLVNSTFPEIADSFKTMLNNSSYEQVKKDALQTNNKQDTV